MELPSGRVLDDYDVVLLALMARTGFVRYREEPFEFQSGIRSRVYVSAREELTDNPQLLRATGSKIAGLVNEHSTIGDLQPCLIGVPTAGTALAIATAIVSCDSLGFGRLISSRYLREKRKERGAHRGWVNGIPKPTHHTYWLVDNAVTTGDSFLNASERLAEDGYSHRPPLLTLVDRQLGGIERLQREGFDRIVVGYNILDIAYAYVEWKYWPKEVVRILEDEIEVSKLIIL